MKKMSEVNKAGALEQYETAQIKIKRLLKQIEAGLEKHDRKTSGQGGHHWGHVGDLNRIAGELEEINNLLHSKGEYAEVLTNSKTIL